MVMAWAFRLGSYLFTRILKDGKDKRFDNVRDNPLRFFSFWTIQGTYLSMHTDLLNFGCTPFDCVGAHCAGIKQNLGKPLLASPMLLFFLYNNLKDFLDLT